MLLHVLGIQLNVLQDFNTLNFSNFLKYLVFHVFEFFPAPEALGPPPRFDNKLKNSF